MAQRFILNGTSYHGAGAIQEIATEVKSRGFKKAFVCSDPDLVKFGVTAKVLKVLDDNGFSYELYSNIKPNPTIENVQTGVEAFKNAGTDYLIAIGGGSSMDTAKAIGIIINNPEFADVRSLEGVADTKNPAVPIIAVPTTAGTAAEVTINYVITDAEKNRKMVCVDPHDIPVVAVVDPDMMSSMPKGLTAATGMDALTHAIEGYITAGAWELSDMFHLKAIEIIAKSLRGAVDNTPEGREGMALGQYIAGMGFSNVGLGIVHSMAHPLGALYDTPHGVANAIILPTGMEYNAPATGVVQVEWKAAKITAAALKGLIEKILANREKITHGEQSLKKLNLQGKKLESIELTGEDMQAFKRELNKYAVDFSIKKDTETQNYTVFFKGQDVDRVYKGLQKCVENFQKGSKKPIKEVMKEAEEKAAQRNAERTPPEHEHSADRGKEAR